jgi:glycosyltransferase involved in cell wall biosynthesis
MNADGVAAAKEKPQETYIKPMPGPILIASYNFASPIGGTTTIMRNLLKWVDPADYVIATTAFDTALPAFSRASCYGVMGQFDWSYRLNAVWQALQIPLAARRIARIARRHRARGLLAVYPGLYLTAAVHRAHKITGIPMGAYLHDTIWECHLGVWQEPLAKRTQERVFRDSKVIMAISSGLSDLLKEKYDVASIPIIHPYNEEIPGSAADSGRLGSPATVFYGGHIYRINDVALVRLVQALVIFDTHMVFYSPMQGWLKEQLQLYPGRISTGWADRADNLKMLPTRDILIAALNWPDETRIGVDELRTIFPTKLPDYLAAGRPILVHCPKEYFLARFVEEHSCGYVISDRSPEALKAGIRRLLDDKPLRERLAAAALKTAQLFSGRKVHAQFMAALEQLRAN